MTGAELHRRNGLVRPSRQPRTEIDTQRGRRALAWLVDQGGTTDLHTWARYLASWEDGSSPNDVPRDRCLHFYTWLYFGLVPRLVQEGVVVHYRDVVWPEQGVERIGEYLVELSTDEE